MNSIEDLIILARIAYGNAVELGPWFHVPVIALLSGMLGSFINVCIWRIPRGESIVLPRSRCTTCGTALGPLDLFPVLSWVASGGKCRHCGQAIAARYVLVELTVITFWLAGYAAFGLTLPTIGVGVTLSTIFCVVNITRMKTKIKAQKRDRGGYTFISVMIAALILGVAIGPYLDLTRTNFKGAIKNQEYLIGYKIAQERLEELLGIPARNLKSDRAIYVETDSLENNIYSDEYFGDYAKMRENKEFFYEKFSDVLTEENKPPQKVYNKFSKRYEAYYGYAYELYPRGFEKYRRVTRIQHVAPEDTASLSDNFIKKITVTVTIDSSVTKGKVIQMEVLTSEN